MRKLDFHSKSRIRETPTLSTDADRRTYTNLKRLRDLSQKKNSGQKNLGGLGLGLGLVLGLGLGLGLSLGLGLGLGLPPHPHHHHHHHHMVGKEG